MHKYIITLPLLLLGYSFLFSGTNPKPLALGAELPMAQNQLKDISGDMISLKSSTGKKGLLVVFSCNTCPWVKSWEDRYPQIAKKAKESEIGMVVLNSNEARRGEGDSYQDMITHAKENGYYDKKGKAFFRYVLDKDHKLADAFGATRTPELFLFDDKNKLVYQGAIDDNAKKVKEVKHTYILDALENLKAGKPINPSSTKSLGCSIKRL